VKVLFKFTKVGGGRSEEDTRALLEIVGAVRNDNPLLFYWMKGLSDQYKKHILAASKQPHWVRPIFTRIDNAALNTTSSPNLNSLIDGGLQMDW